MSTSQVALESSLVCLLKKNVSDVTPFNNQVRRVRFLGGVMRYEELKKFFAQRLHDLLISKLETRIRDPGHDIAM